MNGLDYSFPAVKSLLSTGGSKERNKGKERILTAHKIARLLPQERKEYEICVSTVNHLSTNLDLWIDCFAAVRRTGFVS